MEYLEGCDLEELLKLNGPLAIADACDYVCKRSRRWPRPTRSAIIHRDLKPANLFLALRPDGTNVIKILDFGISKQTTAAGREKALTGRAVSARPRTCRRSSCATPSRSTSARTSGRSASFFEMITGVTPFDARASARSRRDPGEGSAEHARASARRAPELEAVIFKCLARKAEDRLGKRSRFRNGARTVRHREMVSADRHDHVDARARASSSASSRRRRDASDFARGPSSNRLQVRPPVIFEEPSSPPSAKVAFTRTGEFQRTSSSVRGDDTLAEAKREEAARGSSSRPRARHRGCRRAWRCVGICVLGSRRRPSARLP